MNSIFKLITNQQIPETANALVPVIGYEPWSLRALESIKSSIVNGVPTLIRVHSAADYPIENEELSHRLDMESHCVLIVGYNDDKEEFDIVDPWNPNWGGQHGGVGKLPYESLHVACVNCTAEKGTRLSLISHKIRPVLIEENASLAVDLGFYEPLGYVIDRNNTKFETFKVTIHYLFNGNEKQQSQSLSGEWKIGEKAIFTFPLEKGNVNIAFSPIFHSPERKIGEKAIFTFPLEKELSGDIDVRIEVLATLSSDRPYQYRDNICMDFTETVKINRSSGVSQKESVISSINASNY